MSLKKPRLTRRLLQAIIDACAMIEAGSPENLTGYDDEESQKKHEAVCDALEWALDLRDYREQKKSARSRSR